MKRHGLSFIIALFFLISLIYPFFETYSWRPYSTKLKKEKQQFHDSQVPHRDKVFLYHLHKALEAQIQTNKATLRIVKAIPKKNRLSWSRSVHKIEWASRKSLSAIGTRRKAVEDLKIFIKNANLPQGECLVRKLEDVLNAYATTKDISDYIKRDTHGGASSYSYKTYLKEFERTFGMYPEELLRYQIFNYRRAASDAQHYKVARLKKFFAHDSEHNFHAFDIVKVQLITKMKMDVRTWYRDMVLGVLEALKSQLEFNAVFSAAVKEKLQETRTPYEPQLPDFEVKSIDVIIPDRIHKGKRITITADITNSGELESDLSYAQLIAPSNFKRKHRIPSLEPGETYTAEWSYRLREAGEHTFTVIANFNYRGYESNLDNNQVSRTFDFQLPQLEKKKGFPRGIQLK